MAWRITGNKPLSEPKRCLVLYNVTGTKWVNYRRVTRSRRPFWRMSSDNRKRIQNIALQWRHNGSDGVSNHVIMGAMASQITRLTIVYSTVYSSADLRKYQSSASLAFVRGIQRSPVNSPHKWPVTRKMFRFDEVIMRCTETVKI